MDSSTDTWHLPCTTKSYSTVDFTKINEMGIRWATKRYIQHCIEITSSDAGYNSFMDVWRNILRFQNDSGIAAECTHEELKRRVVSAFEAAISSARASQRLWGMYRSIQWYLWCAENYPELGFCPAYALELSSISIPGNPKGEAVRLEDPDRGPFHRSLELPLLIKAMRDDDSRELTHLQQRAVLALSLALGRNPANLTYLKENDLENLTPKSGEQTWVIHMPRIKKGQTNPRDDRMKEYLDPEFANYLKDLIEANKAVTTHFQTEEHIIEVEKPLFINKKGNVSAIKSGLIDSAFNMTSERINRLLQAFVKRHSIISPLSGELLRISPRRLRYTLGTSLAAEGISKKELARILDHSDTQHVNVYFELAGTIVEHLDKAVAKGFAKYLNLFKGKVIADDSEAVNGDRGDKHLAYIDEINPTDQTDIGVCGETSICYLDPPFSCYLCPKFQPYQHADHEHVLDCLLRDREQRMQKYDNARLGIQLDEVICAVSQVVEACGRGTSNG